MSHLVPVMFTIIFSDAWGCDSRVDTQSILNSPMPGMQPLWMLHRFNYQSEDWEKGIHLFSGFSCLFRGYDFLWERIKSWVNVCCWHKHSCVKGPNASDKDKAFPCLRSGKWHKMSTPASSSQMCTAQDYSPTETSPPPKSVNLSLFGYV